MKKLFIIPALLFIILSCYCQKNNELAGAWEMKYQNFVTPDTSVERTQFENPSIKVLSKGYFSFCAESGRGHTGKYYYDGKTYTEVVKYGYNQELVNQTNEFKSKLEGDKWHITGKIMLNGRDVELEETWQRID
ncbi:MAG: hypothetical protein ISS19_06505 [Bacteroidales bacterium]|nr:hypothetical protein [Bacteroidales bacterium]